MRSWQWCCNCLTSNSIWQVVKCVLKDQLSDFSKANSHHLSYEFDHRLQRKQTTYEKISSFDRDKTMRRTHTTRSSILRVSKRQWEKFTKTRLLIHERVNDDKKNLQTRSSTCWIANDNKKNLHDFALRQKIWQKSIHNSNLCDN